MTLSQKQGIIILIKSALTGEKCILPEDFDMNIALAVAKKHQIYGLIYYGAFNCGVDKNSPAMQELFVAVYKNIVISERQMLEIQMLTKEFDANHIDYMLLKGTILKSLYPRKELRAMGDADILIKTEQYAKIKVIMLGLGFEECVESDHELIWKKPQLLVELHKRLIPSYNKDYYAYFGDGWQLGQPNDEIPNRFEMSDEDQMIYLFTHFAKHYRDGGMGIRHIVDLYVYRNSKPNLDEEYIKQELKKLKIYDFYCNIVKTIEAWFYGGETTEKTDFITEEIFGSGVFGDVRKYQIARTLHTKASGSGKKNAKHTRIIQMIFPTFETMKLRYRFLDKAPFLLPITWIMRLFRVAIYKSDKAKNFYATMNSISSSDIADYEESLHFVGLDFNFKE